MDEPKYVILSARSFSFSLNSSSGSFSVSLPLIHCRFFSDGLPTDSLNKLRPLAPVLSTEEFVSTEEVVSLEDMLSRRVLVFDFDTASVKTKPKRLIKPSRLSAAERALLDYESIFKDLLEDSKSTNMRLKKQFCLARLRLNTLLVERLLRDYLKRCQLHIGLL